MDHFEQENKDDALEMSMFFCLSIAETNLQLQKFEASST